MRHRAGPEHHVGTKHRAQGVVGIRQGMPEGNLQDCDPPEGRGATVGGMGALDRRASIVGGDRGMNGGTQRMERQQRTCDEGREQRQGRRRRGGGMVREQRYALEERQRKPDTRVEKTRVIFIQLIGGVH